MGAYLEEVRPLVLPRFRAWLAASVSLLAIAVAASPPAPAIATLPAAAPEGRLPASPPRVAVLTYHDVLPEADGAYAVTPARLEADLRWFLAQGWRPLALSEFREWMEGRSEVDGDSFLLTFDDGYAGVAEHALPVLERLRVPAVVFPITAHLGPVDPTRERPKLRPDQVAALARSGLVAIGSHTHDLHGDAVVDGARVPELVRAGAARLAADLDESARRIAELTGEAPLALAWPHGGAPDWAVAVAARRFSLLFTGVEGFARRGDPRAVPRFAMEWRGRAQLQRQFARRGDPAAGAGLANAAAIAGLTGSTGAVPSAPARYAHPPAGYSVPLPAGWRVDDAKAPVVVRLLGPDAVVDVFDQPLRGISARDYILYSNRSVTGGWNGHELVRQGLVRVAGRQADYLEWRRPALSLLSPDLRHYAEWHFARADGTVLTFMLKATEEAFPAARRAVEQMLAGLRWERRAGAASWNLPPAPARAWTPWQERTALRWRMPAPGELMWGVYDPRFEMKPDLFHLDDFARFEREALGTKLGLLMTYMNFGRPFQGEIMERAARDGRLVMLTLQTNPGDDVRSEAIYRTGRTLYYRLLDGEEDAYLREFARAARRFGKPFLFRLDNEMNGDWTAWSAFQYGKDTDLYVAAWRHVREIFRQEGADNAIWVWNPNCDAFPGFHWQHQSRYWPGADAVDLVGLTCYNTAGSPEKWRSFEQLYRPVYDEYMRIYGDKPFLITEFSSHTVGGDKARWVTEMFAALPTMPNIRMAVWWNGKDNIGDYRLDVPYSALEAFRAGLKAPRFVNTVSFDPGAPDAAKALAPAAR